MNRAMEGETPGTHLGVSHWIGRIDAYWSCQAAGWFVMTLLTLGLSSTYSRASLATMAVIAAWGGVGGLALTHLWRGVIKRRGWLAGTDGTPWAKLGTGTVIVGITQTAVVSLGYLVMRPPGSFESWAWIPGAVMSWVFVMLIWTALYATISAMRRANRLESEALRLAVHAKDSELRALQAQVNPHFFFNSLNSVRALIYENPDAAAQMVDQLAALMRYTLQAGGAATVPLAQEIEAVRAYLAIEKIRFEKRLDATLDIDPALDGLRIPPMTVQTLVENAVKHGVERNPAATAVRVSARRVEGGVQIEVANEGRFATREGSTGVGLENARKRLALVGGAGARLQLAERDGWVVATLLLPDAPPAAR